MHAKPELLVKAMNEYILQCFERKILRRVYGPVCDNGVWRKRYNQELYALFKDVEISWFIKITRLRWAGHVRRKDDFEICKRIWSTQPEGSRKRGRPRLLWRDEVDGDARELWLRIWWKEAVDRIDWRKLLEEAKTQKWVVVVMMMMMTIHEMWLWTAAECPVQVNGCTVMQKDTLVNAI